MRRLTGRNEWQDLILVAAVVILAAACGEPSSNPGDGSAGIEAKRAAVVDSGNTVAAAASEAAKAGDGGLAEMDLAVMDRELQPIRHVTMESLTADQFDALYEELLTKHPKGVLYRNANGLATIHPETGPNFQAVPPDCRLGVSGEGAYTYKGYGVNVGDGKLYSMNMYGADRAPTAIGVMKSGTTLLEGVQDVTDFNGQLYAVNNYGASAVSYRLFKIPTTASAGIVAATSVGPLATSAGTQVRDLQCLTAGVNTVSAASVEVDWTAIGGKAGDGFHVVRGSDPNAAFSPVNPTIIPWNTMGTYCYVDVTAPACSRVYYKIRVIWYFNGVPCQEDSDPFFVDTQC